MLTFAILFFELKRLLVMCFFFTMTEMLLTFVNSETVRNTVRVVVLYMTPKVACKLVVFEEEDKVRTTHFINVTRCK